MMGRQNLHTHTVFDDGRNTPMEMAQAALDAGFASLGFSCHSILPYENDWSLTAETLPAYLAAVEETRAAFAGRLAVYSGIELDGLSAQDTSGFDYVIGSLHHIALEDWTPTIDESGDSTRKTLETFFHGDEKAMIEAYFAQYQAIAQGWRADIVGHFDLLSKFWETDGLFDPEGDAFQDCARRAMLPLVQAGKIFEVNTGAMSRGYRHAPYPSPALLRTLKALDGRVTISTDAHAASGIAYAFRETETLLRDVGFERVWQFDGERFVAVPL